MAGDPSLLRRYHSPAAALVVASLAGHAVHAQGLICPTVPPAIPTFNPISCTVNCAQGGTIASALSLRARSTNTFTITVHGTCVEAVDFGANDGITLQGASSGATIQAPNSSTNPVVNVNGQRITLNNLTISGGVVGLQANHGAQFDATNVVIEGASNQGVSLFGANGSLNSSTIENNSGGGIIAQLGSVLFVNNGAIQNNPGLGVNVSPGSRVWIAGAVVQNNITGVFAGAGGVALLLGNVLIQKNATGVYVLDGGVAELTNAVVQSNSGDGIQAVSGFVGLGEYSTPVTIEGNGGNGIYLGTNSVATFGFGSTNNQIVNNGGWGILCAGSPSHPVGNGNPGTVSGNKAGNISCNFGN